MNKIFRIVWNEAAQAWVAVSELTKKHKKRASATAATAVLATVLSAAVQASGGDSDGGPSHEFDPSQPPTFTDPYITKYDDDQDNYKFGVLVTDENGELKPSSDANGGAISVEPHEGSDGAPKYKSSFLYLR